MIWGGRMDLRKVFAGDVLKYIGESDTFGGLYIVLRAEDTYVNVEDMPEADKGKRLIVEFDKNENPMFIELENLNGDDWTDEYIDD